MLVNFMINNKLYLFKIEDFPVVVLTLFKIEDFPVVVLTLFKISNLHSVDAFTTPSSIKLCNNQLKKKS